MPARSGRLFSVAVPSLVLLFLLAPFVGYASVPPTASSSAVPLSSSSQTTTLQSWTSLGPRPVATNSSFAGSIPPFSGRVTAIVVNGSNTQQVYLGGAQGGVWKTNDGGKTWAPLTDSEPALAIGALALSPDNKTIYAGTGEGNQCGDCYYGFGLLKSADGGASWTVLGGNTFSGTAITSVVVNPSNQNQILVSTAALAGSSCCGRAGGAVTGEGTGGVFLSTDGGASWSQTLSDNSGVAQLALVSQGLTGGPGYIPVAGDFAGMVRAYKGASPETDWSTGTWSTLFDESASVDPACAASTCRVALAPTAAKPNYVFLALTNSSGALAAMRECDIAGSCSQVGIPPATFSDYWGNTPPCGAPSQGSYDLVFAADPSSASNLYFGCTTIYRSTDGGADWTALGGYSQSSVNFVDYHAFAFVPGSPSSFFVGNDGGIWESTNQGTGWVNLNANLDLTQFYYIAVSPTGTNILGGAQDIGCPEYSGSTSWNLVGQTGDGGWVGFDPANSQVIYCVTSGSPTISTDGGKSFQDASSGIGVAGQIDSPVGQDMANPGTFFFGANYSLYETTNNMQSWSSVYNDTGAQITAISVSPSDSSVVYMGDTLGTLFVSTKGGAEGSWSVLGTVTDSNGNPLSVVSIAVSPTNANDVYVATPSFKSPVVTEFLNGAEASLPTNGLPSSSVNCILISQGELFAGLDSGGVYWLPIGGSTWSSLGTGIPNAAVFDLQSSNGIIYAATHGRGVWEINSPTVATTTATSTSTSTSSATTTASSTTAVHTSSSSSTSTTTTSTAPVTSTTSTTATTSSVSSTTSTSSTGAATSTFVPPSTSTSTQSVSSSPTQTTASSSSSAASSGGGVSEFPVQPAAIGVFSALLVAAYLLVRRQGWASLSRRP